MPRYYFDERLDSLKGVRQRWESTWRRIEERVAPGRLRLGKEDYRKPVDYSKIIDNQALFARRTAVAGFASGMTPQSRPWLSYEPYDRELLEYAPVREFYEMASFRAQILMQRSNLYRCLPNSYDDIFSFGVCSLASREDRDTMFRYWNHNVGEFFLGLDTRDFPNHHYREFQRTAKQLVDQFGEDKVSNNVKQLASRNSGETLVTVIEAIEPRNPRDREPGKADTRNMPFRYVFYEKDRGEEGILLESGFNEYPNFNPRWRADTADAYGSDCPGMVALGDVNQLQHEQLRKAEAIDKKLRTPMAIPDHFDSVDLMPGGNSIYSPQSGNAPQAYPMWDGRVFDMGPLLEDIGSVRERINMAYFTDMFLMLQNLEGIQPRNELEIFERKEEKLMMLGPMIIHVMDELLAPLAERTFNGMIRRGIISPEEIPEEILGTPIRVEFTSVFAQALRAIGISSIERTFSFAASIAQVKPEVLDKLDGDQALDEYAMRSGAPAKMILSDDKVAEIRAAKAQEQQNQQLLESAPALAKAAKDMSDANQ